MTRGSWVGSYGGDRAKNSPGRRIAGTRRGRKATYRGAGATAWKCFRRGAVRLTAQGIAPGVSIHLLQRLPTFVIEVGETTLGLESQVAAGIVVRQS